jgi:archaellum component FlaC
MIEPQHMLVEERGLEKQIKRLKEILIGKGLNQLNSIKDAVQFEQKQLNSIVEELENIKFSIKSENDRILKDKLKQNS